MGFGADSAPSMATFVEGITYRKHTISATHSVHNFELDSIALYKTTWTRGHVDWLGTVGGRGSTRTGRPSPTSPDERGAMRLRKSARGCWQGRRGTCAATHSESASDSRHARTSSRARCTRSRRSRPDAVDPRARSLARPSPRSSSARSALRPAATAMDRTHQARPLSSGVP